MKITCQREELLIQFKDCILAVDSLLRSGYSIENAFLECEADMLMMYGESAFIETELMLIRRGLRINISLEELLQDFSERSGCEEIAQFAEVLSIAKRNGGNMPAIIHESANLISRKIELRNEIQTMLTGKSLELKIMKLMPFAILVYIEMANPGYFETLYHNVQGVVIMSICLIAYLGAYYLGERIMDKITNQLV